MVGASIDVRTGNDGLFDTIRQEFIGNGGNGESNISSNSFVTLVAGFDHPAISGRVEHFCLAPWMQALLELILTQVLLP